MSSGPWRAVVVNDEGRLGTGKVSIRRAWHPLLSATICRILDEIGINWTLHTGNGRAVIIIEMDSNDDARLLALWDELTDLRVQYIDARQRSVGVQTSFLEGGPE